MEVKLASRKCWVRNALTATMRSRRRRMYPRLSFVVVFIFTINPHHHSGPAPAARPGM